MPATPSAPPVLEVGGASNLVTSLAQCCKPMPGDEIIGYVTRGRGITIHSASCRNIDNVRDHDRLIKVAWSGISSQRYLAPIAIVTRDRQGLLRDVLTKVADEKINVQGLSTALNDGGGTQTVRLTLEVTGSDQLMRIMNRLEGISGVYEVRREVPQDARPKPGENGKHPPAPAKSGKGQGEQLRLPLAT
jgi:GTP pyrophosphokinase